MNKKTQIKLFEGKEIRREWNSKEEKWYFSVIDIMSVLTEQADFKKAQSYWTTLKSRLKMEGNESVTKCDKLKNDLVTICHRLKMVKLIVLSL